MAGQRTRVADEIKRMRGTFRPGRAAAPAVVSAVAPEPPAYLSPRAREVFGQLAGRLGERASADHTELMALAASRWARMEAALAVLDAKGLTFAGASGVVHARPEVAIASDCELHLHRLLAELGLTPVAASRVAPPPPPAAENPFAGLVPVRCRRTARPADAGAEGRPHG